MRLVYLAIIFTLTLSAGVIKPSKKIKFDGVVKDMILRGDKLTVGTDKGKMQVYDLKREKIIKEVQLPKIKDFMGDIIDTRVASVDKIDNKYLLISDSGKGGYTNVWLLDANSDKPKQIISPKDKLSIVKARFIDKNHILFGFLSNELSLYDISTKKELYKVQLSESKFSDFALNEDKSRVASGCESGIIYIVDPKSGKILKELKGVHVDNVYKVAFRADKVAGAGQDRRASIFDVKSGKGDYMKASFLIYATGLSPTAKRGAWAMNENNDIDVYNLSTKSKITTLNGQKSTLNNIIFIDEDHLVSSSEDDTVILWDLTNKKE